MTKELEAKSQLKAAVVCVGTQLVELREEDRDPDGGLEDPDRLPVPSQLRRVELHWSGLQADAPVLQRALHEVSTSGTSGTNKSPSAGFIAPPTAAHFVSLHSFDPSRPP